MKEVILLDTKEIKRIIAKEYGVDEKKVIKMQYSFGIMKETKDENK